MANHNHLTSDQIFTIGKYLWENREGLQSLTLPEAMTEVASGTSIAISRSQFDKMAKHMQLEFVMTRTKPWNQAFARLQSEVGVQFKSEDTTQ